MVPGARRGAAGELDAVAYSFDPKLARPARDLGLDDPWDPLRLEYARRAPEFLAEALPGLDPDRVVFVPHHVAHAASAGPASPHPDNDVLVLDGRGESASHLAGRYRDGKLDVLATQALPHSLGLVYEELTEHLGFLRSSDEYKVMALASYGTPATSTGSVSTSTPPATAASAPTASTGRPSPRRAPRARTGRRTTPTSRRAPRPSSRNCSSNSSTGCTARPAARP